MHASVTNEYQQIQHVPQRKNPTHHTPPQLGSAQRSSVQFSTAQLSLVQPSSAQQLSSAQLSSAQPSSAQSSSGGRIHGVGFPHSAQSQKNGLGGGLLNPSGHSQ